MASGDIVQIRNIIIPIVLFLIVGVLVYTMLMTRHRERLSLLEKGLEPDMLNLGKASKWRTLKFGMLALGIAIGMIVGAAIHERYRIEEGFSIFPSLLFFGGLSLLLNFFVEKRYREE